MKYRAYANYKDSGVEWLGEIPEEWEIKRLKWSLVFEKNGVWGEEPTGGEDEITCIRVADFDRRYQVVSLENLTLRDVSEKDRLNRILSQGDLLLEKSGGGEKWPVGYVVEFTHSFPAVCSNFIARLKLTNDSHTRFFKYFHLSLYENKVTTRTINQTSGIQNLDSQAYFNTTGVFPPLPTQISIAQFLDAETAKIDRLIAENNDLIALLQEKRKALISHAVTRGLSELVSPEDPEFGEWAKPVKFKDSGVEWLGMVPEGWEVKKLKFACELIKDGTHLPPTRVESGIPLLSVRNLQNGIFSFRDDDSMISIKDYEELSKNFKPQAGDVLLAIVGATLGKSAIIFEGMDEFFIQRSLAVFRTSESFNSEFLNFFFQSQKFQDVLWLNVGFSAQPGIYLGTLENFSIPSPTAMEQKYIVLYLEKEIKNIDSTIENVSSEIELLKEHRSSLITNAVTGKVKVD